MLVVSPHNEPEHQQQHSGWLVLEQPVSVMATWTHMDRQLNVQKTSKYELSVERQRALIGVLYIQ